MTFENFIDEIKSNIEEVYAANCIEDNTCLYVKFINFDLTVSISKDYIYSIFNKVSSSLGNIDTYLIMVKDEIVYKIKEELNKCIFTKKYIKKLYTEEK